MSKKLRSSVRFLLPVLLLVGVLVTPISSVLAAANGDGAMTVSPTATTTGATGLTFTFDFWQDSFSSFDNSPVSALELTIPSGWTTPQISVSTNPGYLTVVEGAGSFPNTCDPGSTVIAGSGPWTITIPMACGQNDHLTITYGAGSSVTKVTAPAISGINNFTVRTRDGSGSLTNISTSPVVSVTSTATNGSGAMTIDTSTCAGTSSTTVGSITNCYDFSFSPTSGTTFPSGSQVTIDIPSGWSAPQTSNSSNDGFMAIDSSSCTSASISGVSGTTVTINQQCSAGQNFVLRYGSGGNSDAVAPNVAGAYTFTSKSKSGSGGTFTTLSSSPVVTVNPAAASKLAVTSINGGSSPTATAVFSVVVQSQDSFGNPSNVTGTTNITLSRTSGTGTLGGTLTGSISGGANTTTFNNITYSIGESGVVITATRTSGGAALTAGASTPFTVNKASQAAFTVTGPVSVTYGNTGALTSTGGSAGAVSYNSSTPSICTVSSTTLTVITATGTCTVTATRAGDATYNPITSVPFTVALQKATQATLTVSGPSNVTYGNTGTLTSAGGSGTGIVSFSSSTPSVCTVSGNTLTVVTATGTCTVSATKPSDNNYNSATSVNFNVTLNKANQSIVTVTAPSSITYGNTGTATATGGTGTGTYSFSTGISTGCSVAGTTVSVSNASGTCALTATRAGDNNYNASSTSASFPVTLNKATQGTLTVTGLPGSATYNQAGITAGATGGTGTGTVTFNAGASTACSVVSGTGAVTITSGTGTCAITATKAADTNYNVATSSPVSITINKANATIVVTPYSVTYDGNPHTATGTAVGVNAENLAGLLNLTGTTHTAAGTYGTDAWSFAGDANYNSDSGTVSDSIAQATSTVTVVCNFDEYVYTGSPIEPCTASYTTSDGLSGSLTVTYTTDHTNVGIITASAEYVGDTNHVGDTDSDTFEITKASSTVTVTCSDVNYTGSEQTPCTGSVSGAGDLSLNITGDLDYLANTDAGTDTASASYTYPGDANHTGNSGSDTFSIGQAPSTTVIDCTPGTFTYTGSALTPCTATVTGAGLNTTVSVNYGNNTNVGTATANASYDGDGNHTSSTADEVTFEITQASSVTVLTCSSSVEYTGSDLTPCTANVTGAGGLNESVSVDYTLNTNVGTATASSTFAGDTNHSGSSDDATFEITQASSTTVITCPVSETFTGSAIEPCTAAVTGIGGLNTTATVTYEDNTNVGTATAHSTYAGDLNHAGSTAIDKTFEINQASSTVIVDCPASETYTGSEITPCTASYTTEDGGSGILSVDYSSNTEVGTATASAEYTGDANHSGDTGSDTFEITKATSTTVVTCPTSEVFTGSAITPCTVSITGANLNLTPTPDYSDNTNAGTATASYTYAGDDNHEGSDDSATFEITGASSVTIVTCPASVTYDGSAQEPCTAAVTGAGGLNEVLTVNYTDNTVVGTANANASFAGDSNHSSSSDSETFAIDAATASTTVTCPVSEVYTGSAIEPCTVSVTGAGGLSLTPTPDYADNTEVGTATASYSFTGDANHSGSSDDASFAITQAGSTTVVVCSASETYTGSEITPCTATVTGTGGLNESLTVEYADNINVGTANASSSFAGDANHASSSDTETFTIVTAGSTTVVTCPETEQTYTGVAQTPCTVSVTGANLNLTPTPNYTDNTVVGTATADYTFAGDANHSGSSGSDTFEISSATATVDITDLLQTYDGTPKSVSTSTTPSGLTVDVTYDGSETVPTEAGSYAVVATIDDANYDGSANGTLVIEKANSSTVVTCPNDSETYTGSAIEPPCTAAVTGPGLDTTATVTYTENTNVGTATASATYAGDENYNGSDDTDTFNIISATATINITDLTHTYDGAPQPVTVTTTPSGLAYNLSYDGSGAAPTDAGSYPVVATITDPNYSGSDSDTLVIDKADATIDVDYYVTTYDGLPHTSTGTATGVNAEDLSGGLDLSDTTHTNVGNYLGDTWSFAGTANYNPANGTVDNNITKAFPVITWANPADIEVGTALSGTQLNATANIPGSFAYTPDSGTVLPLGAGQILETVFTPTDTDNYDNLEQGVFINVVDHPAPAITSEDAGSPTDTTVTVTWTTDHLSTSRVVYDTASHDPAGAPVNYGYAFSTTEDPTLTTTHSVVVTGLTPGTHYYFRGVSHGSPESISDEVDETTTTPVVEPTTVKVTILKYLAGDPSFPATAENTDSASFPMHAVYPGGEGDYSLGPVGFNNPNPYQATTGDMPVGSAYSTYENLPTSCTGSNSYELRGYRIGDTLEAALDSDAIQTASFENLQSDKFVVVLNTKCEIENPDLIKVHIYKYLDGELADTDSADGYQFPMTATWMTENLNGGVSTSGNYVLGNNHGGAADQYGADTSPMAVPADYTTSEITGGDSNVLPIGATCEAGKYILVGYSTGVTLELALDADITNDAPVFTDLTADQYVIVWNEKCDDVEEPPTEVENSCPVPDALGDTTEENVNPAPGTELDLQEILDTASYDLEVQADQKQFQVWNVTGGAEINIDAAFVNKFAGRNNVFGYYVDGDTSNFVPVFKTANVTGYESTLLYSAGPFSITVPEGATTLGFAIKSFNGNTLIGTYATQNSLNSGSQDHVAVYNPESDSYVLAFEDLKTNESGFDNDFNDLVVEINLSCAELPPPPNTAKIDATKIVCDAESDLPNWGAGAPDITGDTASDFLETHPNCHQEDWTFEWAPISTGNPGDQNPGGADGWTAFTNTTNILAGAPVWVREQFVDGYIPFTGVNTTQNVSAELYCSTDVLHYDNYDFIDPVVADQTYNCVAFNVPTELPPPPTDACPNNEAFPGDQESVPEGYELDEQGNCVPEVNECVLTNIETTIVSDTDTMMNENNSVALDFIHGAWTALISDATWIWGEEPLLDPAGDTTETFTREFEITGTPTGATLEIAADNSYVVTVNGNEVCSDDSETNYTSEGQDTCVIDASSLVTGTNTISIEVKNWAQEAGSQQSNPAGLLYKLTFTEDQCLTPPPLECDAETQHEEDGECVPNDDTPPEEDVCPEGTEGVFPDCTEIPPPQVCPEGTSGIFPNCVDNEPETPTCDENEHLEGNNCVPDEPEVPTPPTDVCPNIPGNQSTVPHGKHKNSHGNCVSNGSGGGGRVTGSITTAPGEVLGAQTDICNWDVNTYMRKGYKNDSAQVTILQRDLLNGFMKAGLVVDGIYGPQTEAAVKAFQIAKKDKILTPWNLFSPTGIFYKTTLVEAKNTICPSTILPIPTDLINWSANLGQVPQGTH